MMILVSIIENIRRGTLIRKLKYRFLRFFYVKFCSLYKINSSKILFDNFGGLGFGCNPKYICIALHKLQPELDLVWVVNLDKINRIDFPEYVRLVDIRSLKAIKEIATSKVWVCNYREPLFSIVGKKKDQFYLQTWHGNLGPKKSERKVEHLLPQVYVKMAKKDSSLIDLCLSNGRHVTEYFSKWFWYDGKIEEVGTPRNDILINCVTTEGLRKKVIGDNLRKLCLYAPSFRKDNGLQYYNLDYDALRRVLNERFGGEWVIGVRLHPNLIEKVMELQIPEYVIQLTKYPDIQELLAISDCVITDYSSLVYDYMFTNKPVFIFATDYEEYKAKDRDLNFTIDETPFPVALTNEELQKKIMNFDNNLFLSSIDLFKKHFGVSENGSASISAANIIMGL